jgi:hypothetical protein
MKLQSSHFTAPLFAVALTLLAGCSSDDPSGGNTAGTSAGGSAAGGKAGASGGSVGGAGAGGAGAGGSAAGSPATAGTAGSGVAGSGAAGGAGVEATFEHTKAVISKSCFGAICHDLSENPLVLKPLDMLYTKLMAHTTKNCGKLVNTASPADSALVKILQKSCGTPGNMTDRMPYQTCNDGETFEDNPSCIPETDIAAIQAWIAKGAPQ